MTRNRLLRDFAATLAFVLAVLAYAFCTDANAQVVQPQYVRPSKGVSVLAFPGSDGKGLPPNTAGPVYSAVFDFSAFESVQVFISARNTSGTSCTASFASISVFTTGSFTKTGASTAGGFFSLTDPYAIYNTTFFGSNSDITYAISSLPTYLQFVVGTVGANADPTCRLQVNIIPDPFASTLGVQGRTKNAEKLPVLSSYPVLVGGSDYQGINSTARTLKVNSDGSVDTAIVSPSPIWYYENTTPVTIATGATATRILTVTGPCTFGSGSGCEGARFQNIGTVPVYCGPALATTTTAYQFSLKASASTDDGTGGIIDLPARGRVTSGFWCVVSGATTGKVAVMRIAHD